MTIMVIIVILKLESNVESDQGYVKNLVKLARPGPGFTQGSSSDARPYTGRTTIFPFSSLSTCPHGTFGSWVNMVTHFSGIAFA